jgi:hypothetical protein
MNALLRTQVKQIKAATLHVGLTGWSRRLRWMTVVADGRQGSEQGQPGRSKDHRTRFANGSKSARLPLSVRLLVQSSHLWPGPLQLLGVSVRPAPDCVFFLAFLPPARTRVSNIYPGLLIGGGRSLGSTPITALATPCVNENYVLTKH